MLPKRTDKRPAAPEKFCPVIVTVRPGEAAAGADGGDDRRQIHHVKVAEREAVQTIDGALDIVVIPGHGLVVVGIDGVSRPR